jgi:hypothetical protein
MVFLFHLLVSVQALSVKYKDVEIVKNSKVSKVFDPDYSKEFTCHPVQSFVAGKSSEFMLHSKEGGKYSLSVTSEDDLCKPSIDSEVLNIGENEKKKVLVDYDCEKDGWDVITLTITNEDNGNEDIELVWRKYCGSTQSVDFGLLILLVVAVCIVSFAAYRAKVASAWESQIDDQSDVLTIHHAYGFVVVGSLSLILLFFFQKYLKYVLEVLICISGTFAVLGVLNEFNIEPLWPNMYTLPIIGATSGANLLALSISALLILVYVFTKSWFLNNLIGLSFAYIIIKTVKIPNFKVGGLLLGLAFFYDIFWVFFSQYAFGDNVMVSVASGLDLPIKVLCPHFSDSAYPKSCSMLGLGDLALPGLFLAFASRFDQQHETNYLKVLMICYASALLMCILVLVIFEHAQPALLYISPLLIFGMLGYAYKRDEVKEIIQGVTSNPLRSNEIPLHEIDR